MITLSASGGSVTFEFSGNSTYLNDGQITVPVNSLALIIDESDMATFRKAASNDIFVSANIAEFGMTKAELESWYKDNMVGSTGGGGGVTSGEVQTMIDESISGKADSSAVTEEISAAVSGKTNQSDFTAYTASTDAALSGKVDTEDLDISGKTLYVGDYHGGGMPYELTKEYPISTKPTKLLLKTTYDVDSTNVVAFQLYFDNGTTSGSCILRVSTAVGSGITEAAWQVETPEASLELVNGEVYITFLNGYYLTMFKSGAYQYFVMQIVTDIESGSTPSVVESGIYNALEKMSETLTDVITKSDAAYYRGIGYPSLSYSSLSGITFSSSAVGVGVGINTATTSTLATDASIDANNGVLGVYTTGATHTVIKNDSDIIDRISINSIPSNIKMYWNSSYTGNTSHYIAVNCTVNDGTNGYCRWDWNNGQYVPNVNYVNTAVTLSYDSTNQVVTITPSSSSALTSIIYVRCNRNIAPSSALTQDNCKIGLVTIDSNSYKLQEALDNKQDILSAGTNITISGNVISANGVEVSSAITENDTNPVEGGVLYDELRIVDNISQRTQLIWSDAGDGVYCFNLPNNCYKIEFVGGNENDEVNIVVNATKAFVALWSGNTWTVSNISQGLTTIIDGSKLTLISTVAFDTIESVYYSWSYQTTSYAIVETSSVTPLIDKVKEDEQVTAAALNELNARITALEAIIQNMNN